MLIPLTFSCLLLASNAQGIPLPVTLGILKTEGGRVGMESPNRRKNGRITSYDLGPMQINDVTWVPVLAKMHFHGNTAQAREAIRDWGCYNVQIGTWILHQYLNEANGNMAEAIGLYNSHNPVAKARYQERFAKNFKELFALK